MIEVEWSDFKAFLKDNDIAPYYVESRDIYHVYLYEGPLVFLCKIKKNASYECKEFENFYKEKGNVSQNKKTSLNYNKVALYEPEGFFKSYVSHNLCDPTTWYQDSTQITGETLTLDTGLTYNFPQQNIIDLEHGKVTGEKDYSLNFQTFTYSPTLRSIYAVKLYDDGVLLSSGYTIDYALGKVTLDTAPSGALTADYFYESGSAFKIEAEAGKIMQIRHVEIQFTKNITFRPILQQISAYNPLDPPNKIEVEHIEFLNEFDVINIGNEGKGQIPQYGILPADVLVFPFSYGRTIDLKSSEGTEISVKLEGDNPMGGDWATVTFYTTEEDET